MSLGLERPAVEVDHSLQTNMFPAFPHHQGILLCGGSRKLNALMSSINVVSDPIQYNKINLNWLIIQLFITYYTTFTQTLGKTENEVSNAYWSVSI